MQPGTIEIRSVSSHEELRACVELQIDIWGESFTDLVPASILKVAQRIGGVTAGAFDRAGTLIGFVFGLTGVEQGRVVHWSDMLAVRPDGRNLGLGRKLKEYQRDMVRSMGGEVIYWTFDPLIARNAHINFNRLGVRVAEYAENMYGVTESALHGGLPTDRLVVAWSTDDGDTAGRLAEAQRALASSDCREAPVATDEWIRDVEDASILPYCIRVPIPRDGETMLLEDPQRALRWRTSARHAIRWGLEHSYTIDAVLAEEGDAQAYYLMTRTARQHLTLDR
jgi:predicted GNAT superfamily acetyltransferase